ncbi:MAG: deoxyribonuclease IV [Candidatus Krumholzibacteriia bacterium]
MTPSFHGVDADRPGGERPAADRLGAHVSTAGGLQRAPARAASLPAGVFQIFVKNQVQWRAPRLDEEQVDAWRVALAGHGYTGSDVCAHDSYLINLAATDDTLLRRSRAALVDEIERCARLGIRALVLHPGAHLGAGEAAGVAAVAASLDRCIDTAGTGRTPGTEQVLLCLETTAGQGTNLGHRFAHLRDIIAACHHPERLAVCLDTCHVLAAGYGVATAGQWRRTLDHLEARVGLARVRVVHVNDSRRPRGSRVDRHARVGAGEIGRAALVRVVRTRRLAHALKILEVPGGEPAYAEDLSLLRARGS